MFLLRFAVFLVLLLTVLSLENDVIFKQLKEEDSDFPLDERIIGEEVSIFKNMEWSSQMLEIKRKLMQTLGRVRELYKTLGIHSISVESKILSLLKKVETVPNEDSDETKRVFRQMAKKLNALNKFIYKDIESQNYYKHKHIHKRPVGEPEAEWAPPEVRPPYNPYPQQPAPEGRPPRPQPEHQTPGAEWGSPQVHPPHNPYPQPPVSEWRPPQSQPEHKPPAAEWGSPEWRPPQNSHGPGPIPEGRPPQYKPPGCCSSGGKPPRPQPEFQPPGWGSPEWGKPEWGSPPDYQEQPSGIYYPPIKPPPQGKIENLISGVRGIVITIKALIMSLI